MGKKSRSQPATTLSLAVTLLLVPGGCRGANQAAWSFVPGPGSPLTSGPDMGPPELGDLNGDGHLDIVVPCARPDARDSGQLSIFLGDGTGRFRESAVATGTRSDGLRLGLGDIDGDGRLDAVMTRHDEYRVWVFLGDGSGNLRAAPELTTAVHDGTTPHTHDVAVADVNADGKLDVLAGMAGDNAVAVLLGDGAGRFRPADGSPFPAGNHPYEGLIVGDLTGDGRTDIAAPNLHGHALAILAGKGDGHFEHAPGSPFPVGLRPGYAAIGRIDADRWPDCGVDTR